MLEALSNAAARLRPLMRALVVVLIALLVATSAGVFLSEVGILQTALPALIALTLWVICALAFILAFSSVPARPTTEMRGLPLLGRLLSRGFHWLLLGTFALITVAALLITSRILTEL